MLTVTIPKALVQRYNTDLANDLETLFLELWPWLINISVGNSCRGLLVNLMTR